MQRSPGIFAGGFVAIRCLSLLLLYRWGGRGLCGWGEFFGECDRFESICIMQELRTPTKETGFLTESVDCKDGKIWIQRDRTEAGIGNELVAAGAPKEDIVLAFKAPYVRQFTEFAVG
ncbi:element excision factor XisI family protein [Microcoleus anatoxicus]|uniref:Element excision factor XisI family protein n=1 Tax=Microcoleus anatoxicus PTRS2 TaxID=2705321 RepID=A0ABU8YN67_9CYAN